MAEWRENQVEASANQLEYWVMYFNGSLKLDGGGAGVLFISPKGEQVKYVFQILFEVSNNEAEYEALLHGPLLTVSLGIKRLLVYGDSLLVVQQVNKEWDINKDIMDAYVAEIRKLENKFSGPEIHHVIRDNNAGADVLSKLDSDRANPTRSFRSRVASPIHQDTRSKYHGSGSNGTRPRGLDDRGRLVGDVYRLHPGAQTTPWRQPKSAEATRIVRRSKGYVLVESNLYKCGSASGILMKCVRTDEGSDILQEIHEGVCGNHATSHILVGMVFRSGFYWPTALADAEALVRRCTNFQFFSKQPHISAHNLITIPPSWSFVCWGLDMTGPLTTAPGGFTHVLVAVNKFMK
jgi:ribonuclease HI